MDGSRFVVRHVDVSVAALDTIWRWRGWASTDRSDRMRDHRSIDVYRDGSPDSSRVVGVHQPLSDDLQEALGPVEWAVASTIAGAQDAWRPALGALRSARRGAFKHRSLPTVLRRETPRSRRQPQPVRLNCVIADVTNVWEGATIRLLATPVRTELQVRSPGTFGLGELPTPIQKALRYGASSMRQSADLQLTASARVLAGRVPSHVLIEDLIERHRLMHAAGERGLHLVGTW